jgi:hypothetical protein
VILHRKVQEIGGQAQAILQSLDLERRLL